MASCASAEHTRCCGTGSTSKRCGQCIFSADRRQQSGRIKAVSCWFESGRCVGALSLYLLLNLVFSHWWQQLTRASQDALWSLNEEEMMHRLGFRIGRFLTAMESSVQHQHIVSHL